MGTPLSIELLVVTKKASAAIEANRLVKVGSTEGEVTATSAITDAVFGVSLNKAAAAGDAVSLETGHGAQVRVTAGGNVAVGDRLMPLAAGSGKVVLAAGATAFDVGVALQAGGDGETIIMMLNPMGRSPVNS